MEESKRSKKKIILKVSLVFIILTVGFGLNIIFNTRHAVVPDGGAAMHDYLMNLEDKETPPQAEITKHKF